MTFIESQMNFSLGRFPGHIEHQESVNTLSNRCCKKTVLKNFLVQLHELEVDQPKRSMNALDSRLKISQSIEKRCNLRRTIHRSCNLGRPRGTKETAFGERHCGLVLERIVQFLGG